MNSALTRRPSLPALTSARFFAALAVLFFHFNAIKVFTWPARVTGLGFIGVSFFFVLSGFILVYSHAGQPLSLPRFYRARFARIYPAYAFSLVLSAPFLIWGTRGPFAWIGEHLKLSMAAVLLLVQGWLPMAALAWNGVAWSLSVEALFYLLFPFLLARLMRMSNGRLLVLIGLCWMADLALSSTYLSLRPDGNVDLGDGPIPYFWKAALKFNPAVHVPEFLEGMAGGLLFVRGAISLSWRTAMASSGLAALALLVLVQDRVPYLVLHTGLLAPAFAALIAGLALRAPGTTWLDHRWLVALGNASYSLYLLHFVVMIYVFFVMRVPFTAVTAIAYLAGIMLLSLLVFRFIEEPARRRLSPGRQVKLEGVQAASAPA